MILYLILAFIAGFLLAAGIRMEITYRRDRER